jgi:hypothetical protein
MNPYRFGVLLEIGLRDHVVEVSCLTEISLIAFAKDQA